MPSTAGRLIIFDGIDGVGKTSQIELARKELSKSLDNVISLRYLGSTPIGEALREIYISPINRPPETTVYLATAILAALIERVEKERQDGKIILMDRGPLSLAAYQIYGDQMDMSFFSYVDKAMAALMPDLIIIYDLDVQEAFKRKNGPEKNNFFESKSPDYFNRVRQAYLDLSGKYPEVKVIDARSDMASIHASTMNAIEQLVVS